MFPLFATGVIDNVGKFAAAAVDTGGKSPPVSLTTAAKLLQVSLTPVTNCRRFNDTSGIGVSLASIPGLFSPFFSSRKVQTEVTLCIKQGVDAKRGLGASHSRLIRPVCIMVEPVVA